MAQLITTVKDLLTSAYRYAGVLGEGADLSGDRTTMGLHILNQLITQANMEVFIPFAQVIKDLPSGYNLYILSDDEEFLNENIIPAELSTWGHGIIIEAIQPKIINSVGYKTGIQYTALKRIGTAEMMRYTLPVSSAPNFYAYEEWSSFTALLLDRPTAFPLRVTYSKNIELANYDDKLNMPMQYVEYLMYGLAYRLAIKYQQPLESISGIKSLFDAAHESIVSINKNDQTITWGDLPNGTNGWFGEIYAPHNW
jgi:hypothetical protein